MPVIQLTSILLYCTAALCVFLMLLNRVLILMPGSRAKGPMILAAFAISIGVGALTGYFSYRPPWVFVPVALLILVLLGEVRRVWIRRSCAAAPPVDTRVSHPKWRGAPLRIVHLTDLHVHPKLPLEYYQQVISVAEQTEPDVAHRGLH